MMMTRATESIHCRKQPPTAVSRQSRHILQGSPLMTSSPVKESCARSALGCCLHSAKALST
eukprot:jgi/Astpho2/3892/e_gw1.00062.181.1_t